MDTTTELQGQIENLQNSLSWVLQRVVVEDGSVKLPCYPVSSLDVVNSLKELNNLSSKSAPDKLSGENLEAFIQTIRESCTQNNKSIDEYIDEYELEADEGSYTPNDHEKVLITDSIYGLISDEEFVESFIKWKQLLKIKSDMSV
ncbi:MAG: hypothetical protein QM500_12235 [Methylococcales bacterium]